jgi:small subunit ribosomal protein S17
MPRKKKEETEDTIAEPTEATEEETPVQASAEQAAPADESTPEVEASADAGENKPRKAASKKGAAEDEPAADIVSALTGAATADKGKKFGKRAEKVGIVSSDKMMKTVTVRVDRLVKHPVYRKYVKRRKKFMAHDDLGAKIGDKVKIVETRPMSARKRWRVVEIIQRAEL